MPGDTPERMAVLDGKGTRPIYPDQSVPEPAALKR
jgi:hypothetical protein